MSSWLGPGVGGGGSQNVSGPCCSAKDVWVVGPGAGGGCGANSSRLAWCSASEANWVSSDSGRGGRAEASESNSVCVGPGVGGGGAVNLWFVPVWGTVARRVESSAVSDGCLFMVEGLG
ncbi:hypothetical protein FA13DRAFT_161183 [Coprinellus micaceus]|uniref:Uncharacterized protein n=1 Tax=Coprinellus micaceus TaxID=71717 RepID=A0A4Y7THT4_COPMI|nr:hypothetical protein FA13DRAFT_161183 [Coprinellus micaceus]